MSGRVGCCAPGHFDHAVRLRSLLPSLSIALNSAADLVRLGVGLGLGLGLGFGLGFGLGLG